MSEGVAVSLIIVVAGLAIAAGGILLHKLDAKPKLPPWRKITSCVAYPNLNGAVQVGLECLRCSIWRASPVMSAATRRYTRRHE